VQVHAENGDVIEVTVKDALAEGKTAPKYHALTRPVELESEATSRAIRLAEVAGAPLYVVHVSSAMAADAISDGRKRGLAIYGETCPQYLLLDVNRYDEPGFDGAKYVLTPPLREQWNHDELWGGLRSHALDVISTALYVAVTVLLDQLFRQVSKSISLLAVLFGLAGCTVSVLNMYNLAGSINPLLFFGPLTS